MLKRKTQKIKIKLIKNNYTEQEKNLVSSLIDYLFNNSQIKKMSYYKLSKNFLIAFTKKQNK